ncbi:unnamed protein product [Arabidopsis lyrata]|nr:unnamed protein product [Arabidopsis lyrata]
MRTSSTSPMKDEEPRNWVDLPSELTSLILIRLSVTDILENARKVCSPWRRICKDPSMWRKIDMRDLANRGILFKYNADSMRRRCRDAVDLSQGGLLEIKIDRFVSDSLLSYIADRSSNLKSFALPVCYPSITTIEELVNAIAKFPFLETLEFFDLLFILDLKAIGHACPQLKTLKINFSGYTPCDDDDAIAIAESMPELRHLQLIGNGRLTDTGLNAIRDGCPHLEHLDSCDESLGDHDRHEIVTRASVILMRS